MSVQLYLHCGWPRTGTTSLQAVLARNAGELAEAGVVYPDRWRPGQSDAHNGIQRLLEPGAAAGGEVEAFQDYLRTRAGGVLISCEALSNWLPAAKREALIAFLRAASEAAEVTCLWTLRRLDRWAGSMHRHLIATGRDAPPTGEYFRGWGEGVFDVFSGMRELEKHTAAVYFRYEHAGAHHGELLETAGVGAPLRGEIEAQIRRGPRRNRDRGPADSSQPVDAQTAEAVRRAALRAASATGFEPYVDLVEAGAPAAGAKR